MRKPSSRPFRLNLMRLSLCTYLLSLTQMAFYTSAKHGEYAIELAITGAIGFMGGGVALTWLANPFLIYSWFCIVHRDVYWLEDYRFNTILSLIGCSISTIITLSFLFFEQFPSTCYGTDGFTTTCDKEILRYGLGYYLWLLSSLVMVVGSTVLICREKRKSHASLQ